MSITDGRKSSLHRSRRMDLAGWGNWPVEPAEVFRPEKEAELKSAYTAVTPLQMISRGLGRSYGDAALNRDHAVTLHERLDRFLGFDMASGVLECEAGVSLAEILHVFLPRGFFLPVTPGTKYVTVGGAIAADVHGKNHHRDGSIGNFVESFELLTAEGQVLQCSSGENPDVFGATLGGMGLTGAILSARLRLLPVQSAYVEVDYQKAQDLDAAMDLLAAGSEKYRYSVAWIDCLASGAALGRCVLMQGDHAAPSALPEVLRSNPLAVRLRRKKNVPIFFPEFVLRPLTVRAFNSAYYKHHAVGRQIVDYDHFFYPLDAVSNWNRIYGKRGFHQYQAVIPSEAAPVCLRELLESLSGSGRASFLAVLKTMGESSGQMLSFPMKGYTLALDLPASAGAADFLRGLDQIVLRHGGRVYLAKDSCMTADTFRAMYPQHHRFSEIKAKLDPHHRIGSSLSRRLGIGGAA